MIDPERKIILKARAAILKAMAHETRLFIMEQLATGPHCVCELQAMIGADMSTVSKHLSVLKHAGIIVDERRGANIFYHLRVACALDFLTCCERIIASNADEQQQLTRILREGCCS
ncbi:winged helix-turn-helix transcriptional regulator [bacterium]|nr:winged helix-turn-helix transcriptional regulator [candidate division CSSED10-310 bacterium]